MERISGHTKVAEVRTLGVVLALDLNVQVDRYGNFRDYLYQFFMERGVNLRPLGNTVYVLPPFIIEDSQLQQIYDAIENVLEVL